MRLVRGLYGELLYKASTSFTGHHQLSVTGLECTTAGHWSTDYRSTLLRAMSHGSKPPYTPSDSQSQDIAHNILFTLLLCEFSRGCLTQKQKTKMRSAWCDYMRQFRQSSPPNNNPLSSPHAAASLISYNFIYPEEHIGSLPKLCFLYQDYSLVLPTCSLLIVYFPISQST